MAKRKATKQALAALPRELEALRLRQVGLTYDAIAARLGYATRASA
jgi:DNA-binding CsgD family transcriptional regulator